MRSGSTACPVLKYQNNKTIRSINVLWVARLIKAYIQGNTRSEHRRYVHRTGRTPTIGIALCCMDWIRQSVLFSSRLVVYRCAPRCYPCWGCTHGGED